MCKCECASESNVYVRACSLPLTVSVAVFYFSSYNNYTRFGSIDEAVRYLQERRLVRETTQQARLASSVTRVGYVFSYF